CDTRFRLEPHALQRVSHGGLLPPRDPSPFGFAAVLAVSACCYPRRAWAFKIDPDIKPQIDALSIGSIL
ncbi:MAG: hypothetical protein ACI9J0_003216, partial [Cryomorphaceae bacterium]